MGCYSSINAGRQSHGHPIQSRRFLIQQRARPQHISSLSVHGHGEYCPPKVLEDSITVEGVFSGVYLPAYGREEERRPLLWKDQ